jgi:hypothetical protein
LRPDGVTVDSNLNIGGNMRGNKDTAVHLHPVWRDRADFIIAASITGLAGARWEQLWARQLSRDEFEICCIPFFLYNLSLGDVVQTEPRDQKRYVVSRVLLDAGYSEFLDDLQIRAD